MIRWEAVIIALFAVASWNSIHALPAAWMTGGAITLIFLSVTYFVRFRGGPPGMPLSPLVGATFRLALPLMVASGLLSVLFMVDRLFAASLATGSIASLGFAFMFVTLPTNIAILPATTAVFPFLSDVARSGREDELGYHREVTCRTVHVPLCPRIVFWLGATVLLGTEIHPRMPFRLDRLNGDAPGSYGPRSESSGSFP